MWAVGSSAEFGLVFVWFRVQLPGESARALRRHDLLEREIAKGCTRRYSPDRSTVPGWIHRDRIILTTLNVRELLASRSVRERL